MYKSMDYTNCSWVNLNDFRWKNKHFLAFCEISCSMITLNFKKLSLNVYLVSLVSDRLNREKKPQRRLGVLQKSENFFILSFNVPIIACSLASH